jgi:hypothetical protein
MGLHEAILPDTYARATFIKSSRGGAGRGSYLDSRNNGVEPMQ